MAEKPKIRIQSIFGEGVLLLDHLQGEESLSGGLELQLSVFSTKYDLQLSAILGTEMTIEFDLPRGGVRYFHGFVASFGMATQSVWHARYTVTLRSWLWMLTLNSDCRVFQNKPQTIPDIVKAVCKDHGFTNIREIYEHKRRAWDYCVQYRENNYNFVNRLLEQEGIYYFFEHKKGESFLILADGQSAHKSVKGYEKIRLVPQAVEGGKLEEILDDWMVAQSVRTASFSNRDFDFTKPKADLFVKKSGALEQEYSSTEAYDYPGEYLEYADGQAVARIRMEECHAGYEVFHATGNVLGLGAGNHFELQEHPRNDQNAKYLIVAASYNISGESPETGDDDNGKVSVSYKLIRSDRAFRPPCETPKPRVDGPQTATVIGLGNEVISTDPYGRVKVKFHWDRVETSDEKSSCWIRVAQIWAGSRFGGVNIPRKGEEVIVEFLEGDPDRPIITGRVYNANNMPPYDLPANKTQTGIKTRSTKDGKQDSCTPENFNEIRFEDLKDKEELHIQAERDMSTLVKRNQSTSVVADRSVSVGGNQSTTVTKKETQTYQDDRAMTVAKKNSDEITGAHTGTYHGGRTEIVEKGDTLTVQGSNKVVTVHGEYNTIADTHYQLIQGTNTILLKGSEITINNGSCKIHLNGSETKVTANAGIKLETGGASISMKSDGTIEITGKTVKIGNPSNNAAFEPAGTTINGVKVTSSAVGIHEVTGALIKIG